MYHLSPRTNRFQILLLTGFIVVLIIACVKKTRVLASDQSIEPLVTQKQSVAQNDQLKKLIAEANWQAVEEAKRQGSLALSIIRPFITDKNYQVRQIAVNCVGAIGDPQGADVLVAGLKDENVNVRSAAARELSEKPYPAAAGAVLEVLKTDADEILREMLATAAGFFPGDKTVAVLRPLANGDSILAANAMFALAKLGDVTGHKLLSTKLAAKLPRTRYDALEGLCYVNDLRFALTARQLLSDRANAVTIGSVRNQKIRRVCDQAVDSLVCLLKLKPPFEISPVKIYTDQEIATVRNLVK